MRPTDALYCSVTLQVHGPAHSPVSTHAPGSGASGQALELPLLRLGETPSMQHEVLDSAGMPELELEQVSTATSTQQR